MIGQGEKGREKLIGQGEKGREKKSEKKKKTSESLTYFTRERLDHDTQNVWCEFWHKFRILANQPQNTGFGHRFLDKRR